jgi:hypothetical protein
VIVVSDAEGKRYLSTGTIIRDVSDIDPCPVEKPRTTSVQKIRGAYAMSVSRHLLEDFSFVINERIKADQRAAAPETTSMISFVIAA